MDNSVSFKVVFSEDNVRRFRIPRPSFEDFVAQMQKLYSPNYHPELRIQYVDTEGDVIDVTSELEWNEMFKEIGTQTVKLYIRDSTDKKYFKDGPAPEVLFFYNTPDKQPLSDEERVKILRTRIPKCLESLFLDHKILPHNLPSFLEGVVKVTNLPDNQVELDVDIELLRKCLDKTALMFMETSETVEKGRNLLKSLLVLDPEDHRTLYNLACAESLLGNVHEAIASLRSAVQFGWNNLSHMLVDADLANIRQTEAFQQLVQTLKTKLMTKTPAPVPAPKTIAHTRYPQELITLHDMGFVQDNVIIPLLERFNGNVQETINAILH